MSNITVEPKKIHGEIIPPPDKSISHRAVIISSLARGTTHIKNLSVCEDCLCTINAFRTLGIIITKEKDSFIIQGKGLDGLISPKEDLYVGNSGTSMRLILGVLAGQSFNATLSGDESLSKRPMRRVIDPLSLMGAKIQGTGDTQIAPLAIEGQVLHAISYNTPVASAQVKSAILLAGLYPEGETSVAEPAKSRDHTERMLKKFGADITTSGLSVSVRGRASLGACDLEIPSDISAASFFIVGACLAKDSKVHIRSVGLNPTRTAVLDILQKMGARIEIDYKNSQMAQEEYPDEPIGNVRAEHSLLKAVTVAADQVPSLIDELPILMVAATQAQGQTRICGAGELRVKETDRISAIVSNLTQMGAAIKDEGDDVIISGPTKLKGATVESYNDHRIAMCMAIAGLIARGRTCIKDADCVNISFPGFFERLTRLTR